MLGSSMSSISRMYLFQLNRGRIGTNGSPTGLSNIKHGVESVALYGLISELPNALHRDRAAIVIRQNIGHAHATNSG